MEIIGHRGAKGLEPENTLLSFKKAMDIGVDAVEFDVHLLKSGELAVIHDMTVNRTTNGRGLVKKFTYDEIHKLNAGKGQPIPTLGEVLDLINKRARIKLELKGAKTAMPASLLLKEYVSDKGWAYEDFEVFSFSATRLNEFRRLLPQVKVAFNVTWKIPFARFYALVVAKIFGFKAININRKSIKVSWIKKMTSKGYRIGVWTVNSPAEIKLLAKAGADCIITDRPDLAKEVLR